ncbi:protein-tyrosine-phosphatase [Virgisporangium aliadipatigenens]|uniref:Protein-tyrosine-phosphatase n=1 Tax=Virgisporangium aliadipatigenens TaxID=741659 RepID=A0A8J3YXU6_9ACTN|nr:low molecular weight phosphatase family protein [Virgisporangium aliadipatigenens]GIJ51681.1 protein-tyrosine-phosphatase [Virgisporangium aliadipatigenens]
MEERPLRLLLVCHANVCRSPLAERLARDAFAARLGAGAAEIFSAGTHATPGRAMHEHSAAVLRERGIDPERFATRLATPGLLAAADLVLTATRAQRAHCVTIAPSTLRRTFTMRQFARLAEAVAPERLPAVAAPLRRLPALMDEIVVARSRQQGSTDADDLKDPLNSPIEAFRECAKVLDGVVDVLVTRFETGVAPGAIHVH